MSFIQTLQTFFQMEKLQLMNKKYLKKKKKTLPVKSLTFQLNNNALTVIIFIQRWYVLSPRLNSSNFLTFPILYFYIPFGHLDFLTIVGLLNSIIAYIPTDWKPGIIKWTLSIYKLPPQSIRGLIPVFNPRLWRRRFTVINREL